LQENWLKFVKIFSIVICNKKTQGDRHYKNKVCVRLNPSRPQHLEEIKDIKTFDVGDAPAELVDENDNLCGCFSLNCYVANNNLYPCTIFSLKILDAIQYFQLKSCAKICFFIELATKMTNK